MRAFGYWNVVPLAVGLTLFQVGEFAFVLARVGLSSGAISDDVYTLTLNTAIVTMALTPVVSSLVPALYERFWPQPTREALRSHQPPVDRAVAITWSSRGPAVSAAASPTRCRS